MAEVVGLSVEVDDDVITLQWLLAGQKGATKSRLSRLVSEIFCDIHLLLYLVVNSWFLVSGRPGKSTEISPD